MKCPKCGEEISNPSKSWKYGVFLVKMYKCDCGNQFRQYFQEGKLKFILSVHDGSLATGRKKRRK